MTENAQKFVKYAMSIRAIQFGKFELKSKRVSPYFFNSGLFASGEATRKLARAYARAIIESGIEFDVIFGPAYKGIPLAATVAYALAKKKIDVPWYADRKEVKNHGDKGQFVGDTPQGRVLIIDDVVTTAKTKIEAAELLKSVGAEVAGVIVAFDRIERGVETDLSAAQALGMNLVVPIIAVSTAKDLLQYLEIVGSDIIVGHHNDGGFPLTASGARKDIAAYLEEYGVK